MSLTLGLGLGLMPQPARNPFVPAAPNDGAVVFDGTGYYSKEGIASPVLADSPLLTLGLWFTPQENDLSDLVQASQVVGSGKTIARRSYILLRQLNTEALRLDLLSGSVIFRAVTPFLLDVGEPNLVMFSLDTSTSTYKYLHFSETSGLTAGNLTPSTDTGADIDYSSIRDISIGAGLTTTGVANHTEATIAQVYLDNAYHNLENSAVQDQIITSGKYKNMQNLGQGLISHSGNTASFAENAGTYYNSLNVVSGMGLSDGSAPSPPFVL